jgi:N-methylhydantoinase A/oxoprolinase/acetone carboxylase beta subunit
MALTPSYLIGVDTGGTYTDAAIIEARGHRVVARAKAITTKGDLAIGVAEAITLAVAQLPQGLQAEDIALVSVSTTLATNAVVEGHGSPVGVVLIGFDAQMVERTGIAGFPGLPVEVIAGGHDHNGDARVPLDLAALDAAHSHASGPRSTPSPWPRPLRCAMPPTNMRCATISWRAPASR